MESLWEALAAPLERELAASSEPDRRAAMSCRLALLTWDLLGGPGAVERYLASADAAHPLAVELRRQLLLEQREAAGAAELASSLRGDGASGLVERSAHGDQQRRCRALGSEPGLLEAYAREAESTPQSGGRRAALEPERGVAPQERSAERGGARRPRRPACHGQRPARPRGDGPGLPGRGTHRRPALGARAQGCPAAGAGESGGRLARAGAPAGQRRGGRAPLGGIYRLDPPTRRRSTTWSGSTRNGDKPARLVDLLERRAALLPGPEARLAPALPGRSPGRGQARGRRSGPPPPTSGCAGSRSTTSRRSRRWPGSTRPPDAGRSASPRCAI